jgi:hypothetical protein
VAQLEKPTLEGGIGPHDYPLHSVNGVAGSPDESEGDKKALTGITNTTGSNYL